MHSRAWLPRATRPSSQRTAHGDAVVGDVDGLGPGALEQLDAPPEEVVLQHGGDLRVLLGQDLLAADDEGHAAPEGGEHVDELDAGDARADDDEVLG
jgi:hypothetical protein